MTKPCLVPDARIRFAVTGHQSVLSVDDSLQTLLGFDPSCFLDGTVSLKNQIHPDDQDISDDLFSGARVPAAGTFNIRLRQQNGRIRCCRGRYERSLNARGDECILDVLLQDAKSLCQSDDSHPMTDRLRALLENTDDYVCFKDRNHVYTGASQTVVQITDPTEHWTDLLGLTDYDVFPEAYADIYYRLEKQVFAGIPVAHEVQEVLTKEGHKGWVDNRKYPIRNPAGEFVGLFGVARDITAQKRAEDALGESEHRFRSLFEQVPMISVQGYNKDREVIFWNQASERLYGFSSEQAMGRRLETLIIPKPMRDAVVGLINAWADGGPPIPAAEWTLIDADANPVEVFSSHVMLPDRNDALEMYSIDIDISERKRVAEALRQEQQFTKSLLDNLPGIFYLYSYPENRLVLWNKRHETLLGYEASEMAGRHISEWQPPEYRDVVLRAVDEVMDVGQSTIEGPLLAKDGHQVYFTLTGVRFETPNHTYLMGVGTDITERKKIEKALLISEERHRFLVDNISDVVWVMNLEGRFTYYSPSVERLRGFTPAEAMQQSLRDVMAPESLTIATEALERMAVAVKAGQPSPGFRGELEERCKDGSSVWTEASASAMHNAQGEFIGILGVTRDISRRKEMEEQVHQLAFHDPLTDLPNRRLLNDRLSQAMGASKRTGYYGAVMFLDLDNFKPLNDVHGHEVGDLLLIEVAERLKGCVRETDTVARFGGDEFVVMIRELEADRGRSVEQAGLIAEKIRRALSTPYSLLVKANGEAGTIVEHRCSASIGVVLFNNHEAEQKEILKWADAAMYQAKDLGRNRVHFHAATIAAPTAIPETS